MTDAVASPALVLSSKALAGAPILGYRRITPWRDNPTRRASAETYDLSQPWIAGAADDPVIDLRRLDDGGFLDEVPAVAIEVVDLVADVRPVIADLAWARSVVDPEEQGAVDEAGGRGVVARGDGLDLVAWEAGIAFGCDRPLRDLLAMMVGGFEMDAVVAAIGHSQYRLRTAVDLLDRRARTTYVPHFVGLSALLKQEEEDSIAAKQATLRENAPRFKLDPG